MAALPHQLSAITLDDLEPCDSFGEAIGELPAQRDSCFYDNNGVFMGTWECEVGKLKLDLEITEFCHILQGHWVLTDEEGTVTEVKAGDSFAFPKGWKGTAEVIEKVRKVYTMIE